MGGAMTFYPYNTLGDDAMMAPPPSHSRGYGYGMGNPLLMPRNQDSLPPHAVALPLLPSQSNAALIAAQQEAELAKLELVEAERAERILRANAWAQASCNAEEATRAARMRLGLANVRAKSYM
jgi:hypothetical protein